MNQLLLDFTKERHSLSDFQKTVVYSSLHSLLLHFSLLHLPKGILLHNKYDQCLDCNTGAFPQNIDPEVNDKENLVNGWY